MRKLDLTRQRDEMRQLLNGVLGQEIYLVFASELGLQCHGRLGGFTAVGLSELVRESMPETYRGPLPAIAIVGDRLHDGTFSPDGAALLFDSLCLHEAAHIAAGGVTANLCPDTDGEALREIVQTPAAEWAAHAGPLRWIGHDWRFIRALCHIHHRVESRGRVASLLLAMNSEMYRLSSAKKYAAALGDECTALSSVPLAEALALPMPTKFQKLWTDDVVRSLKSCPV